MEKKAAKALLDFVFEAKHVFEEIVKSDHKPSEDFSTEKALYSNEIFDHKYADFEAELANNVRKYEDIKIIKAYLTSIFKGAKPWGYKADVMNYLILELDIESEFLFGLKKNIDNNLCTIKWLAGNEGNSDYVPLKEYIDSFLGVEKPKVSEEPDEVEPTFEKRFDFNALKVECSLLTKSIDKISLINNRLFDFKQWQLQSDVYDEYFSIGAEKQSNYKYTRKYYPKFEALCEIEIKRLQKQMEIEKQALTLKAIEQNSVIIEAPATAAIYKWESTGTDFLELFTALYQNNSIKRADGKGLTRKEMLEYFQDIFGLEISDLEGKLNKAGNRNNNTPFIDQLSQQFREYVAAKEERKSRRK